MTAQANGMDGSGGWHLFGLPFLGSDHRPSGDILGDQPIVAIKCEVDLYPSEALLTNNRLANDKSATIIVWRQVTGAVETHPDGFLAEPATNMDVHRVRIPGRRGTTRPEQASKEAAEERHRYSPLLTRSLIGGQ